MLVVNFKTYQSAIGQNALQLARICETVAKETGIEIIPCVQAADVHAVSKTVSIPVFAQHIDAVSYGAHTGSVLAEAVKESGAQGTLLNHSEKQIPPDSLSEYIKRAHSSHLKTIVCADTPQNASVLAQHNPDYIAIEPPELISSGISVSQAQPEIITNTITEVQKIAPIPVLCGAGIRTSDDIKKARELGAKGILIASGVTKAENPEHYLRELIKGFG